MKSIKVGICGLGTVASAVVNVLQRNAAEISARAGCTVELVIVGARRENPGCDVSKYTVVKDIFAVVEDPSVDVIVELIGGIQPAKDLILTAIENGKHVVTANKALIAEHGNVIFAAAEARGVSVWFEAAVAGGIPIIKALREGLAANKIEWLAGIINGTGNFILTEMRDKGRQFDDVLADAQRLGYAEADPTFDVEGIDAAHKLVILASLAFGIPLSFEDCFTQGISEIEPQDVIFASEFGYQIKHLGIARKTKTGVELRVHPTLIPKRRLIANVDGVMNAVLVKGDAVGPTLYYGAGAGGEPTASAVIADIVDAARSCTVLPEQRVAHLAFTPNSISNQKILPIEEVTSAYYLRVMVRDKPGVLSEITQILSSAGVSIEAVSQKSLEREGASTDVNKDLPVVLITDVTVESNFQNVIEKIEQLDSVVSETRSIRLESLG